MGTKIMKIFTWNMGFWQHKKKHDEAWEYLIYELKPDFALLQEIVPSDKLEESGKVLWRPIKRRGWGTGIYCPDLKLEEITINSIQYRGWVKAAKYQTTAGDDLVIASIHVPTIKNWAYPYIKEIFDLIQPHIEEKRFIVGGDLNSCRLIDEVQGSTHHNAFFDSIESSGFYNCVSAFHDTEPQTFFGKHANNPYQDDHLFIDKTSKGLLKSCEILEYKEPLSSYSDHVPVVMELNV
jgi:exonuclease III